MTASGAALKARVAAITAALAARADPAYEAGMRRTVPGTGPAHATRIPEIRRVAVEWSRTLRSAPAAAVLDLCEALWRTGWREERIAATQLLRRSEAAMAALDWSLVERWSAQIDNWEHVDNLADVTGHLLLARPDLLASVRGLAESHHPWQRRLALVTLIVAARRGPFRDDLALMAGRLRGDRHPLVRRAFVWARRELNKVDSAAGLPALRLPSGGPPQR